MQKRKDKEGRRNHDKDTGMFALTFSTITSFPATNGHTLCHGIFTTGTQWRSWGRVSGSKYTPIFKNSAKIVIKM